MFSSETKVIDRIPQNAFRIPRVQTESFISVTPQIRDSPFNSQASARWLRSENKPRLSN